MKRTKRTIYRKDWFSEILEEVEKKEKKNRKATEIGRKRENLVETALTKMKQEGKIKAFVKPGRKTFPDVIDGIDFYVVYIGRTKRHILPLSVTGPNWVGTHHRKHPQIPIVPVDLREGLASIEAKILDLIKNNGSR